MHHDGSIGFSVRLCAFFTAQDHMLDAYLRDEGFVSYGELTLLSAMYELEKPTGISRLSEFLMLKERTVRQQVLELEDKGYVVKFDDPLDSRYLLAELTEAGRAATVGSDTGCYELMHAVLWENLPEDDFVQVLKLNMRACVDHIRGFSVEGFEPFPETNLPLASDHLVFWRVILNRWSQAVRKECATSLTEFCVLEHLIEQGVMRSCDVAEDLLLPRSVLSLCKKHLVEAGLITQKECEDGRECVLTVTDLGKRTARTGFDVLDAITRDCHLKMAPQDVDLVNAWYARMFMNMWRNRQPLKNVKI